MGCVSQAARPFWLLHLLTAKASGRERKVPLCQPGSTIPRWRNRPRKVEVGANNIAVACQVVDRYSAVRPQFTHEVQAHHLARVGEDSAARRSASGLVRLGHDCSPGVFSVLFRFGRVSSNREASDFAICMNGSRCRCVDAARTLPLLAKSTYQTTQPPLKLQPARKKSVRQRLRLTR